MSTAEKGPVIHLGDDTLKMLRETLCVALFALERGLRTSTATRDTLQRLTVHRDRLQRLVDDIDRQRPLGPDGTHGDRHTETCGCEDR